MNSTHARFRADRGRLAWVPLLLACAIGGPAAGQAPAPPRDADRDVEAPTRVPAEVPAVAEDVVWPRVFTKDDAVVTLQQPQVDEWNDFLSIAFRSAIDVVIDGGEPRFGVIEVRARTEVDKRDRRVVMTEPEVTVRFPDLSADDAAPLVELVRGVLPGRASVEVSLDRVVALAGLKDSLGKKQEVAVNLDPPPIFYSSSPAKLLVFLGSPRFEPIKGTTLQFATNTNWDVLFHDASKTYWILDDGSWISTPNLFTGPFTPVTVHPRGLDVIPRDPNWADVRAALPARPAENQSIIFTSAEPAELIVTDGPPEYEPIPGTSLEQVVNTDATLLHEPERGIYYFLVAGRWFSTTQLDGSWSAATLDLPEDFRRIPADGSLGDVRVSIPGTEEADVAVALATVPDMATVSRSEVTVDVVYDGDPVLEEIAGTDVKYVLNTSSDVFLVDGSYYCCHQGVWFVSPFAEGPWAVCDDVPASIYAIPPTSPKHNVTYVKVYESTSDTVTVGSSGGYLGELLVAGVVVFGAALVIDEILEDNDYWYHSHWHAGAYSYGCGAVYRGDSATYYRGASRYGPYGGARAGAAYNPSTGAWARGAARYGPNGAAFAREGYNPFTDTYAARAGGVTPYGGWSRGVAVRGDEVVRGGQSRTVRGSAGWAESSSGGALVHVDQRRGGQATVARDAQGNVYVGKDGRVYGRGDNGEWESRRNDARGTQERSDPRGSRGASTTGDVRSDLDRQAKSRETADRRTRTAQRERTRTTRGGSTGRSRGGGRRR